MARFVYGDISAFFFFFFFLSGVVKSGVHERQKKKEKEGPLCVLDQGQGQLGLNGLNGTRNVRKPREGLLKASIPITFTTRSGLKRILEKLNQSTPADPTN